ncbi:MAG TPA: alpha/beta fold hydrolase [Tepidisphaeraceae bacterium]|jgi:predicted dienelactone hydrolase
MRFFAFLGLMLQAALSLGAEPNVLLQSWKDAARQCEVPVKIYLPADTSGPAPVILFSHGLGASREMYGYLGTYWAEKGFVAVHLTHVGSDDSVWRNATDSRVDAMMAAASAANYVARLGDIAFVIDELTRQNAEKSSRLFGRLNLEQIGMAGHSFGALTAQAEAGQSILVAGVERVFRDPRIKAVVAMSPAPPPKSNLPAAAFARMAAPIFYLTGTADFEMITMAGVKQRREPFDKGGGSDQYLAIFAGGDHGLFVGRRRGGARKSDAAAWAYIQKATTEFFNAYLRNDPASLVWMREKAAGEMGAIGKLESKKSS